MPPEFVRLALIVLVVWLLIGSASWLYQTRWQPQLRPARRRLVMVKPAHAARLLQRRAILRLQQCARTLQPIAITQNGRNDPLLVAADTVAALLVAGVITNQTKAIKAVWDLSPSGTNPEYARVVAAIKTAKERRTKPAYAPIKNHQQQPLASR